MHDGIARLLTRQDLGALRNVTVSSRFTVEGNLQGAHRSPLKGFSIEFADYRQYVRGDDLRHLDWKVYGKNERLYVRQYEEECNLRVYLLVDASKSMAFGHDAGSKYAFAARLAAGLAYATVQQQDSVGLTLFDEKVRFEVPARSGREHLRVIGNRLADTQPADHTQVADTLHRLAEKVRRRALVVVISDLFDDLERVQRALAHFRRRRHDVIVYHVLDPAEVEFPFHDVGNFEDLETGQRVMTDPREIRTAYQQAMAEFLTACAKTCAGLDIDYVLCTTRQAPGDLIRSHLARRAKRGK
ncbi:MAG: hypothetical protein BWZ02_01304 [Lentisphaerae bacterium ADurb.BinA184]|nr:MAG: hypothetical protein BWZ02_01304 [Lentisphaerae bacterium ADurb.BinA184]